MKKISILLVMFMSVLISRGQTESDFNDLIREVGDLIIKNVEVLQQANDAPGISQDDKDAAPGQLNRTFSVIKNITLKYYDYKDNPKLESRASKLISEFIGAYKTSILSDDKTRVLVRSRSFLNTTEKYQPQLDELWGEIEDYIVGNNGSVTEAVEENAVEENKAVEENNFKDFNSPSTAINDKLKTQPVKTENNSSSSVVTWLALLLGIGGVVLGIISLGVARRADHRAKKLSADLRDYVNKIDMDIRELRPSNFRGTPTAPRTKNDTQKPISKYGQPRTVNDSFVRGQQKQPPYHKTQSQEQEQTAPAQTVPEQLSVQQHAEPRSVKTPTAVYLFAIANSSDAAQMEFYKVSPENNGNKVFMLVLNSLADEVAHFKITPNMSDDFKRSVLNNHEIYLPSTICEKLSIADNPTEIEVEAPGHAKKVDGKWMIQDRIKIRLV